MLLAQLLSIPIDLQTYKEAFAAFDGTASGCISRTGDVCVWRACRSSAKSALSLSCADLAACLRSVAIHATEQDLTRYADEAGLVVEATHSINYTGVWRLSLYSRGWVNDLRPA